MATSKQSLAGSTAPLAIRMPDALHEAIRAAAHHNRRSINAELVMRLEQSFDLEAPPAPATPVLTAPPQRSGAPAQVVHVRDSDWQVYAESPALARLYELLARLDAADRAVALRVLQALAQRPG